MPNIRRLVVKHTEFVIVIALGCALSVGAVMGPRWLAAIQEPTTAIAAPDRVSAVVTTSPEPKILELPVIPARRVQAAPVPAKRPIAPRPAKPATPKPRVSSTAPGFTRTLYSVAKGTRIHGEDVRRLQIRLMILAHVDPREGGDGWYGPRTADGVKKFQRANGLPATGVTDRKTWDAVFSGAAKPFAF